MKVPVIGAVYKACERAVMADEGIYYMKYQVERYLGYLLIPRIAPVSREIMYVFQK